MSEFAVVEDEALDRLREWGGRELVIRMLNLFLEHGPERVDQIRAGLETGSLEVAQRGAHSLKSSAGNLGARRLQAGAAKVEGLAEEGDRKGVEAVVPALETAFEETRSSLQDVLRSLSEGSPGS